jgi:glucosamine--fructose-6-phosphate aminotransferase (isomerizing)
MAYAAVASARRSGLVSSLHAEEIFEQPSAVAATLATATGSYQIGPQLLGPEAADVLLDVEAVTILACGTSYHSGLVARHWIESLAGIPVDVEIASEYRYRQSVPNERSLVGDYLAVWRNGGHHRRPPAREKACTTRRHLPSAMCQRALSFVNRA